MERLVIEGICNKNDAYLKNLTASTKQVIYNFCNEHKTQLKEQDIDFLLSGRFLHSIELLQYKWFFSLLIDVLPQSLIEKFFNKIINDSEYTSHYFVVLSNVTIDKLFIEADTENALMLIESDVTNLDCKFYQEKDLKEFLNRHKRLNIQRLIIDEHFNLDKEDIEKLLSNSSSVKEIIFKK